MDILKDVGKWVEGWKAYKAEAFASNDTQRLKAFADYCQDIVKSYSKLYLKFEKPWTKGLAEAILQSATCNLEETKLKLKEISSTKEAL